MKIELSETKENNEIIEDLFRLKVEEIEVVSEEEKKFIKENNLNGIKHDDINKKIKSFKNISEKEEKELLGYIDTVLEDREKLYSYKCKKYYISGINDIINIIFNEDSNVSLERNSYEKK